MTSSNNYTPLANSGNFYLIASQQPAGVYVANMLADGAMGLLDRVEYVEDLQTKVEALTTAVATYGTEIEKLRAELESLRTIATSVVEKTQTSSKTGKSVANKALAAALRARDKGGVSGVWPEWSRAQQFIKDGFSVEEAADKA